MSDGQTERALTDEALGVVLPRFDLGRVRSVRRVPHGLIHVTFKVESDRGDFCLQALHSNLSGPSIQADYEVVTTRLAEAHFPAPKLIADRDGILWQDVGDRTWRCITWIDGKTLSDRPTPEQAREAAQLLGRFYEVMLGLDYRFQSTHPLHRIDHHRQAFVDALDTAQGQCDPWFESVQSLETRILDGVERNRLPDDLPMWVVHGDPKFTNILFDESNRAVALVDLDTCGRHTILVDIGDAIRSWGLAGADDDCRGFRLDVVESAFDGYRRGGLVLTDREAALVASSGALISWELASRFARDVVEDRYFGWDASRYESRRHHNLARAEAMVILAEAMESALDEVHEAAVRMLAGGR
ncbi:MAG: phosphotransferase [Deltaproteobacteria bacterium]|nr:phosphotransferase [Deltaproteobacteria bacterium]